MERVSSQPWPVLGSSQLRPCCYLFPEYPPTFLVPTHQQCISSCHALGGHGPVPSLASLPGASWSSYLSVCRVALLLLMPVRSSHNGYVYDNSPIQVNQTARWPFRLRPLSFSTQCCCEDPCTRILLLKCEHICKINP